MRISDWSSDVCSSDLPNRHLAAVIEAREIIAAVGVSEVALLQTLTRFPRLGSGTVKVSCDERFQRTAFYRRGHPMGGALVLRSEERRVGNVGVGTCRSRGSP